MSKLITTDTSIPLIDPELLQVEIAVPQHLRDVLEHPANAAQAAQFPGAIIAAAWRARRPSWCHSSNQIQSISCEKAAL